MINTLFLSTVLMAALFSALATPAPVLNPFEIQQRTALHDCGVFIQRWVESSFDIYLYNGPGTAEAFDSERPIQTLESTQLTPPEELPTWTMGSHELVITDVANPVNNDDPGKLSFAWGTETWESWSGTYCEVIAVGDYGAHWGYPTNTSCTFQCDY